MNRIRVAIGLLLVIVGSFAACAAYDIDSFAMMAAATLLIAGGAWMCFDPDTDDGNR